MRVRRLARTFSSLAKALWHDKLLGLVSKHIEVDFRVREIMVDTSHSTLSGAIHKKVIHQVGETVAGISMDRPIVWQAFVVGEDFFDH